MFAKLEVTCLSEFVFNFKHTHTRSVQNTVYCVLYVSQEQKCCAIVHILVVLVQWEGDECKQMLGQLRGFAMRTITPFLKHWLLLRLFPIEEHAVICLIWFKSNYL